MISIKNLLFIITFNMFLFVILIIGIQNSSTKKKVNLITNETVRMPISFIIGISFIGGSLTGGILTISRSNKY